MAGWDGAGGLAGTGGALEDVDAAAAALDAVQDVLRSAFPQEWVSVAADGFTGYLLDVLGRTHRLGWAVADARAAVAAATAEAALPKSASPG